MHQGTELYGSDRSFLAAVDAFCKSEKVDVVLPAEGELTKELIDIDSVRLFYYKKGVLRKRELNRPFSFVFNLIFGFLFYINLFRKYQVVYINTVVMFSALLAAGIYRFTSKRIVCHVREIPTGFQLKVFRFVLKFSGAELIFNSNATKQAFNLTGKVIYNGVHHASIDSLNGKHNGSDRLTFINLLMIGRINDWKGQFFLLQSLSELPSSIRKLIKVRIVGSPFEGYEFLVDELRKIIAEHELGEMISLLPFSSEPSEHYSWADYVVVASTKPEPFGRVAIEAFSYGKPVIAAAHGGLIEVVNDGINGFLFRPNDKDELLSLIYRLLDVTPEKFEEMSSAALDDFKRRFSIESYQENIRTFFKL
ncbi:glycosyltransferase family 4 protein [Zobellella sp. DQSA1]|uniref:glycosyltransferase family 4 protein n=1 Tax=Zobellella sp. DQSA1 TaxID=3342386 RepID=UPI0035BF581E